MNQVEHKVSFSAAGGVGEYGCMWFFDVDCHFCFFDAGFVCELIQNEKCSKIILKGGRSVAPF